MMPSFDQMPLGIDVSNNNGAVNWDAIVNAGATFAFCKASEGTYFRDSYFPGHWAAMKARGIARGSYHFAQPDLSGPEDEAAYFVDAVQHQGIETGDILALDLEAGSGYLGDWTLRWLRRVEALVGFKPILYTSPGFIGDHGMSGITELAEYGLWGASWGVATPPAPRPWSFSAFWQYAVGRWPGVAGECDLNAFNGAVESIRLYGKPGDVASAPSPVPPATVQTGPFAGMTLDQLQAKAEGLLGAVAYLADQEADALTALATEAQRVRVEQVGPRP